MPYPGHTTEEIARRGQELYVQKVRREVEAILDTGFTGHLTLSPVVVVELGLPLLGSRNSVLADSSRVALDDYRAQVLWDGRKRAVEVLATRGGALAGISLIWGHRISLSAVEGGEVVMESL